MVGDPRRGRRQLMLATIVTDDDVIYGIGCREEPPSTDIGRLLPPPSPVVFLAITAPLLSSPLLSVSERDLDGIAFIEKKNPYSQSSQPLLLYKEVRFVVGEELFSPPPLVQRAVFKKALVKWGSREEIQRQSALKRNQVRSTITCILCATPNRLFSCSKAYLAFVIIS